MATFRHFQLPAEPAPNPISFQPKKARPARRPAPSRPSKVEFPASMTAMSEDQREGHFTARFAVPNIQAGAAHTPTFITPSSEIFYLPIKNKDIAFSHTTVEMVERDGDKAFNTIHESLPSPTRSRSTSIVEERSAKRNCIRKEKKMIRTRLNIMRPVKNADEVVQDAWFLIFKKTSPSFLLEARTVCKAWDSMLREDTVWREARIERFGEDSPDPPIGMKERQYADLIAGKGCQNRACPKVNTIKVFWAFRTRMCEDCFKEKTVKDESAANMFGPLIDQHNLLELLPSGIIKSGKYRGTRQWDQDNQTWLQGGNKLLYFAVDVENIYAECLQRIADGCTDASTDMWRAQKIEEARKLMQQTAIIEEWERQLQRNAPDIRSQRKSFFEQRAMELSPPMPFEVLNKMHAYHTAITSRRPPSEKCWIQLRTKIMPFYGDALKLVDYQTQAATFNRDAFPDVALFSRLHDHRAARGRGRRELLPEQKHVIALASHELSRATDRIPPVADEDLVLMTLYNVFKRYNRPGEPRPNGLNTDNSYGPYNLSLDDARLIVEELFEPQFTDNLRRNRLVLEGFRCKGCSRQDCTKKYRFVELFKHIHQRHAMQVGEDYHFDYFARPYPLIGLDGPLKFPWFTTKWPRNLPIAASHQEVNSDEIWHPDDENEYVELARPSDVSAFADRIARKTDLGHDDLLGNLTHAASKLKNTALDKELQTKVMLKYALDLWQKSPAAVSMARPYLQSQGRADPSPTLEQFVSAMTELRKNNQAMSLRFRCGACVKARGAAKGARFVKHAVDFHFLLEHWDKKHIDLHWATDLIDLPDDREVLGQIAKADAELQQDKADIRAREEAKTKNPRKKGNAKATVVLGMDSGMEVFEHLFPREV